MTHSRRRQCWRILRRMAQGLAWQVWILARLGWTHGDGPVSRWILQRFNAVEHGLRCLLVIASAKANRQDTDVNPEPRSVEAKTSLSFIAGRRRVSRLSLSLAVFGDHCRLPPPCAPVARSRAATSPAVPPDPVERLEARLRALAAVFADPQAHVARMVRHIARLGLTLSALPTLRPASGQGVVALLSAFTVHACRVAAPDTS